MSTFFKAIKGTKTYEEFGDELISSEVVARYDFRDQRKEVAQADAEDIAKAIREMGVWDIELCRELCDMAGMLGEYEDTFDEDVVYKAADELGVEID